MKKIILAALIILTAHYFSFAQPLATETRVEYQRGDKAAAMIELPFSADIAAATIRDNMLKKGIREDKSKGFQVFKGARLTAADSEVVDLYFKVDRKARKDNSASIVYLIVGRPNENVALRTGDDVFRIEDAKTYLNGLTPFVDAYNLEWNISQQEETIKKAEKRLKNLQDDQRDYEKKISGLEERLTQTKRDIDAQNAEVSKQRAARDAMQLRRTAPAAN